MTSSDTVRTPLGVLTDITACVASMTRLKPAIAGLDRSRPIGHGAWALPIAGAFVGAIAGSAYAIAAGFGFGPPLAATLAVAAAVAATGALAEWGLATTAERFAGEAALGVRLGATGASTLIVAIILRIAILAALDGVAVVMAAMMAAVALGAAATACVLYLAPLSGHDRPPSHDVLVACVIAVAIALLVLPFGGFAAVIVTVLAGAGLAAAHRRWIGETTEAAVSAVRLTCEIAALLAIAASA